MRNNNYIFKGAHWQRHPTTISCVCSYYDVRPLRGRTATVLRFQMLLDQMYGNQMPATVLSVPHLAGLGFSYTNRTQF